MVNEVNLMNMMYAANGKKGQKVKSDFTVADFFYI